MDREEVDAVKEAMRSLFPGSCVWGGRVELSIFRLSYPAFDFRKKEADNGTAYYRRQMLEQHKELTPKELPEGLFYIYRLVNKKLMFQRQSICPCPH